MSREATVTRGDIVQGLSETGSASVNTVSTQLDIDLEIDDAKLDLDVVIDDVYADFTILELGLRAHGYGHAAFLS